MRRISLIAPAIFALLLLFPASRASARPQQPADPSVSAPVQIKVCLRQPDNSPFTGLVAVHLTSATGTEFAGKSTESGSQIEYSNLEPGAYEFRAVAAGFESQPQTITVKSHASRASIYVVMKGHAVPLPAQVSVELDAPQSTGAERVAPPAVASNEVDFSAPVGTQFVAMSVEPAAGASPKPAASVSASATPAAAASAAETEDEAAQPAGALSFIGAAKPKHAADRQRITPDFWHPPDVDSEHPALVSTAPCPLDDVLHAVGERTQQFAADLEKFRATEKIHHFQVDYKNGNRYPAESRTFDYVVAVDHFPNGALHIDEYRNGSQNPQNFPEKIDTLGLPAFALLFQPGLAEDFKFSCEGLGAWRGRPTWLVRFEQRPDKPKEMRAYVINNVTYSISLKGRAWIDAASMQVIHLESDLAEPMLLIDLSLEHFSIDYAPVKFRTKDVQLWLPQDASLYVERRRERYYREHSFRNFQCFAVETSQVISAPPDSYAFTNTSDRDVYGVLTVTPITGAEAASPISISFKIRPGARVFKAVGKGKDVNLPASAVASATFAHNGDAAAVSADAFFSRETTLELITDASLTVGTTPKLPSASPTANAAATAR